MQINLFTPKNKVLKKYIECFYTLDRKSSDKKISYTGFPTNTVFVTICRGGEFLIEKSNLTIKHTGNSEIKSILILDNQLPGITTYYGKTEEITIYFKPLGISAFLNSPLSTVAPDIISVFNPFEDFASVLATIFSIQNKSRQIDELEDYLIVKCKQFEHPFLRNVIDRLTDNTGTPPSISDIAKSQSISRPTLNKHFHLHLATTPAQFIKIERFRNAIKRFTKNATQEQLVDIAYLVDYFDQSHMVKDFKSLTGYSPKLFFSKLSQIENNQINWIFS